MQQQYNNFVFIRARSRALFWKSFVRKMGKNVIIMSSCMIQTPSGIEIGDNVIINHNTTISGQASLKIGNYVMIGPNCNILTSLHGFETITHPIMYQKLTYGSVTIGDDVWLGANVVVLPGVTLEKGAIVGANAVVTKNVKAYAIVGGVPAKLIRYRNNTKK